MHVGVEAWITRLPEGIRLKVTEAKFVFVAVDGEGNKRALS